MSQQGFYTFPFLNYSDNIVPWRFAADWGRKVDCRAILDAANLGSYVRYELPESCQEIISPLRNRVNRGNDVNHIVPAERGPAPTGGSASEAKLTRMFYYAPRY